MGQVTVFSGPERRRRWSDEERLQIVAEAFAPGARVADVCRRHDVSSGLIYTWRRKLLDAGVAQKASPPEALPAPVFAEAVFGLVTVLRRSPISLSHLGFECERADA
ncbi:transposase, partial [Microcoleus sp. SVA1_B3]|uniref:transposase n=1 Tax=Microcoleus sp. SVA1_B3 TaxID=2818950 RepID=UPI002FD04F6C